MPATVHLTWTDGCTDETGVEIEHSDDNAKWALYATAAANGITYTTGELPPGVHYFRVRCKSGETFTAYSGVVTVTIPPVTGAPAGLAAEVV